MKGYIRKRGNKYSFTVDIGKDPRTGKRKQKTVSGFRTKKEAQTALAGLVTDVDKGNYVEFEKKTFKEFATNYMENIYQNRVKGSSYATAHNLVVTHIIPFFGEIDLNNIDQFLVHEFYAEKKKKGYSSAYIQRMHELMRMLLRVAFKWELIKKDIASMLEPPKLVKKKMNVWTIEQVNEFLEFSKRSRYYPVFFIAAYTGMRKGEILGLTWDDVDLEDKKISVNKTLAHDMTGFVLQTPKTENSIRTIYIDDDVIKVFRMQKVRQNTERLEYGNVYKKHNMVFAQETGELANLWAVNQRFNSYIKQLGLPKIRFHDLRHTHATLLMQMGINPKIVSERLGHSSVQITLDTYSHVMPTMKEDLTEHFSVAMKSGQTKAE